MFVGKAGHLYTSSTAATNMFDGDGNLVTAPRHGRPTNLYLPIECPPKVEDFFPDPYDCSVYHYCNRTSNNCLSCSLPNHCIGGVDKPSYCDGGLYWDKSKVKLSDRFDILV